MKLGVIGDDFTGSSDVGLVLAAGGLRTVQYVGVPERAADGGVDAGVISLKTRSVPAAEAVERSLAALGWLRAQGCTRVLFKYCSTFDSTPAGNIGPVLDALAEALGVDGPVVVCPAFPKTGRTVYQGHLFVGDRLLSESGLEHHPLNPMTDPDLRRWLARQSARGVGHVPLGALRDGTARKRLSAEAADGRPYVVCDGVDDEDLVRLADAARDHPLLSGGSGIALGLPALHGARSAEAADWTTVVGDALVLCGSCSTATRGQLARHRADGGAQRRVDVASLLDGTETADRAFDWARTEGGELAVVYTSDDPERVREAQERHGAARAAAAIEAFFGELATRAVAGGVRRLIVAGGETSGAVVTALGIDAFEIGPAIDPGVPALRTLGGAHDGLAVALKSGNFGRERFFAHAAAILADGHDGHDDTAGDEP